MAKTKTFDNESPIYQVKRWRSIPQAEIYAFEEFLWWCQYETDSTEEECEALGFLIERYFGNLEAIAEGEQEMLEKWNKSNGSIE